MTGVMLSTAALPTLAKSARMGHARLVMGKEEQSTEKGGPLRQAQVFLDLHELAHSTLNHCSAYLHDNNDQALVDANDKTLEKHGAKTVKAAK